MGRRNSTSFWYIVLCANTIFWKIKSGREDHKTILLFYHYFFILHKRSIMLTRPKTKSIVTTQKMVKSLLVYCFLCFGHQPEQRNAFSFGKTSAYTPHNPRVPYQAVTKPTDSIYIWQNDDPPNSSFKNEIDSVNSEKQKMYGTRKLVEDTIKYAQDTKQNVLDSDMYTEEISYFGECDETINWNSGCRVCKVDMISNARTAQPTISPSPFVSTSGTSTDLNTIPPTVTPSPSVKSPHEVLAGATPNPLQCLLLL